MFLISYLLFLHHQSYAETSKHITWGLSRSLAGVGQQLPVDVTVMTIVDEVAIVCLPGAMDTFTMSRLWTTTDPNHSRGNDEQKAFTRSPRRDSLRRVYEAAWIDEVSSREGNRDAGGSRRQTCCRHPCIHRRHGFASGDFLQHDAGLLDESSIAI